MDKDKLLLSLEAYELTCDEIELYINKDKRKRFCDRVIRENSEEDAREHLKRFEKKMKEFYKLQKLLDKNFSQFPELIKEENGFIHSKFYKYNACKYTDKDVEYKKKLMFDLSEQGVFISVREFLEEQAKVINDYFLDQKKDENEVIIRTIDNLLRKHRKDKQK